MGRLMVITTPDLAPGFQLAGVETFAVENTDQAETLLHDLMAGDEAGLIVVHQGLLEAMSASMQHKVSCGCKPVVMAIPDTGTTTPGLKRERYITEIIRRAIGFQITFGPAQPENGK